MEAVDIFWGDEANQFTKRTLKFLIPTIRKPRSEIWLSWNPEYHTDAVEELRDKIKRLEPDEAFFIDVNYTDNRFASEETHKDAERDKKDNYEEYLHVWEGHYKPSGNNKLFDFKLIEQSKNNPEIVENTVIKAGLDVAREGDDKCVLCIVQGKRMIALYEWPQEKDSYKFALKVSEKCYQHNIDVLSVDSVGIGGPVADHLRKIVGKTTTVKDFDCRNKSFNPKFANLKVEAMYKAMEWMRSGGRIISNKQLIDDLIVVEYDHNGKDELILISKKKLKAEGIPSHDYADAFAMAVYSKPVIRAVAPMAESY